MLGEMRFAYLEENQIDHAVLRIRFLKSRSARFRRVRHPFARYEKPPLASRSSRVRIPRRHRRRGIRVFSRRLGGGRFLLAQVRFRDSRCRVCPGDIR